MKIDPSRVTFVENDPTNEILTEELQSGYNAVATWTLYIDGVSTKWYLTTYEHEYRPGRPYSFVYDRSEPDFETLADAQAALVDAYLEANGTESLGPASAGTVSATSTESDVLLAGTSEDRPFGPTSQRDDAASPGFGMHVVIEFNTSPGLAGFQPIRRVVGPFKVWDAADAWVEKHDPASFTVVALVSPDDPA
jgi:hypothetical protein